MRMLDDCIRHVNNLASVLSQSETQVHIFQFLETLIKGKILQEFLFESTGRAIHEIDLMVLPHSVIPAFEF